MRRASARSRNAGFTLIEALLATMLMLAILGALAVVTSQWMPNWDRGFVRLQRAEILTAGLERLVSDLAAAQPVSTGIGGPNDYPVFEGTELSVTFIRTKLGPNLSTGLEVVQIAETRDDNGLALVRRTAPFLPTAEGQRNFANPVVVVRAPYRVSFSYSGGDREDVKTIRLYEAFRDAKKHAGENTEKLTLDSFQNFLARKTDELRQKNEKANVEFIVSVEDGRVKLKARTGSSSKSKD